MPLAGVNEDTMNPWTFLMLAVTLALLPVASTAHAAPHKKAKAGAHAADKKARPPTVQEKAAEPAGEKAAGSKTGETKAAASPAPAPGTPEAVARQVQDFYATQPGFQAKFTQVVKKKGLSATITREGKAWIKKGDPSKKLAGKMRWEYPTEEVQYVCNGETLWSYEKREQVATKVPVKNSQLWQATAYLVGQGELAKDFTMALDKSPLDDAWALKLVPRKGTQLMRSLTLLIDKKTGEVRGSVLVDPLDDSSTLQWKDVKYEALDDKLFEWTPPPGVTVKTL
jgi:chaperone LolA